MRIPDNLLNELIENEGELRTGPVIAVGVLRLALDLKETREALRKVNGVQQQIMMKQKNNNQTKKGEK